MNETADCAHETSIILKKEGKKVGITSDAPCLQIIVHSPECPSCSPTVYRILIIDAFLIAWLATIETSLGQPRDRHSTPTTVLYVYLSYLPVLYPYCGKSARSTTVLLLSQYVQIFTHRRVNYRSTTSSVWLTTGGGQRLIMHSKLSVEKRSYR